MQDETKPQEVEEIEQKILSESEIKKRLKSKSKSELIQVIIYLSKRIDELKIEVKNGKE
jgi:hypothetical protein